MCGAPQDDGAKLDLMDAEILVECHFKWIEEGRLRHIGRRFGKEQGFNGAFLIRLLAIEAQSVPPPTGLAGIGRFFTKAGDAFGSV